MTGPAARDEMVDGAGRLRVHWHGLLDTLAGLGREVLAERGRMLDRSFADEGITSLLPGAGPGTWRCDPVPLIIPASEFAVLEAGLAQRARLLDAVLADIYGPQHLLAEGALPPALVYANPAFIRSNRVPGEAKPGFLHFYAAELLRGPDGAWRVIADRTAFANGISYAMENRRMMARTLPELFRSREVRRLQPFFDTWQDALQRLAPPLAGNPSVALLTPGPDDPMWSEHVVLSRRLSCALVEDGDLTVRDGTLYLKTLRGLQRVDVLLRRQDGRTIDPLELDVGARTGVPGLLDAARSGAVRIVNDPGAGLVEAPALAAFLPMLAKRLLGEGLLLPGVTTMWLGEPRARELVCQDLSRWFVRSALDGTVPPVAAGRFSSGTRRKLLERIAAVPWQFSASAIMPPSVAPCAGPDGMVPRPVVLRMFLVHDGEGWRTLQGGLARVLSDEDALTGRLPRQGLSKDVWVPADEDDMLVAGPGNLSVPAIVPRRTQGDLPSRVADNFYWLGRYLERLESLARLLRLTVAHVSRPAAPTGREIADLRLLTACLAWAKLLPEEEAQVANAGALLASLAQSAREDGVLSLQLTRILRLTRLLRDRLTEEMYATLTASQRGLAESLRAVHAGPAAGAALLHAANGAVAFAATVAGLAAENMVRGGGRLFMDLGRRVERAQEVAAEVALMLDQPGASSLGRLEPGLRLALELRDSVITYRSRYLTVLQPAPVLDLVLADEGNPRSLAYQLAALREGLGEIGDEGLAATAEALLDDAHRMVRDVARAGNQAQAATQLPPRLRVMEAAVAKLSNELADRYFALLPAATRVGPETDTTKLRGAA